MSVWVLVADASRARFFSADKPASPLTEVTELIDPVARLHDAELTTDTDNRGRSPKGMGSHGPGDAPSLKTEQAGHFAQQICDLLGRAHRDGKFSKLYVVAAPAFLGILRKCRTLSHDKLVVGEVAKNLGTHSLAEIRAHLPQYL